ncbi:MFS transporter [Nonomuraea typhae]|uniref:MFS transporter n=1 Tax=Nonomuraea typhae TaxID=2603600 RepID=UPI001C672CFD|nr:MFS transporter [Nonomuraea typhae]
MAVLIMTIAATALLVIDITIVSIALPAIQADLGGSLAATQWIIIGYTVTFGALQQPAAALSDRLGRRTMFTAGITVFTLSSLACGMAPTALALDLARLAQGAGAALIMANALPMLAQTYEGQRRNMAIAVWGTTLGAAGAAAPVIGGLLLAVADWRALFLVNVPVGVAALVLCRRVLPADAARGRAPIDWLGAGLLVLLLTAANLGLTLGQWWYGAAAAILLAAFLAAERRAEAPVLDLSLFRIPTFVAASLLAFVSRVATIGSSVYYVLSFERQLGLTPLATGLLLSAILIPQLLTGLAAGRLQARFSPSVLIAAGSAVLAAGGVHLALAFSSTASAPGFLPGLILWGVGGGLAATPKTTLAVNVVEKERAGMASGMVNTMLAIGAAAGVGLLSLPYTAGGTSLVMYTASGLAVLTAVIALVLVRQKDLVTGAPA